MELYQCDICHSIIDKDGNFIKTININIDTLKYRRCNKCLKDEEWEYNEYHNEWTERDSNP